MPEQLNSVPVYLWQIIDIRYTNRKSSHYGIFTEIYHELDQQLVLAAKRLYATRAQRERAHMAWPMFTFETNFEFLKILLELLCLLFLQHILASRVFLHQSPSQFSSDSTLQCSKLHKKRTFFCKKQCSCSIRDRVSIVVIISKCLEVMKKYRSQF